MSSMTTTRRLLGASLVAGLTAIALGVSSITLQEDPPPQPLAGVDKRKAKLTFPASSIDGEVAYDMAAKTISIEWAVTYSPGAPNEPHLTVQTEPTSFWPTEVSGAGPGKLAIAGKNARTGNTVIEIWEFTPPTPLPAPSIDPTSGATSYPQIHVPITSRSVVFDERTSGKSLVWVMFPRHATSHQLFVQFWDSRDLYTLDLETKVAKLILSPRPDAGVPHEPALANGYVDRWSARHVTHGFVYFFSPEGDKALDLLALFDRDMDGEIDEHRTLTREEFKELGLADGAADVQFY